MLSTCPIFLEINPACSNVTCQNGGSCVYISETRNAVCSCYNNFAGEVCEGIIIKNFVISIKDSLKCNDIFIRLTKAIIFSNLWFSEIICGRSAIPPVLSFENRKRVVGGMEVVQNAWPWQISLRRRGE